MKTPKPTLFIFLILFVPIFAFSQSAWDGYENLFTPVQNYVVYQASETIQIDGKSDEASWSKAKWTSDFVDIEGDKKPKPLFKTRTKMLWDNSNLYVLAELKDPNIWAYLTERDQVIYHDNDIEVFIDPNGNGQDYFEFEVNAQNALFDLFLPKAYRNGGTAFVVYNSEGFESAVSIDGTLNNPTDTDTKWTVEMKIPFADLRISEPIQVPEDGEQWRINFSRVNWQTDVENGKNVKRKDPATNRNLPEYNWVWSAPGIISMHAPERYGLLQFSTNTVGKKTVDFLQPKNELLEKYCWLIYYKQQDYRHKNKTFASKLQELALPQSFDLQKEGKATIELYATPMQFTVIISDGQGNQASINDNGLLSKHYK